MPLARTALIRNRAHSKRFETPFPDDRGGLKFYPGFRSQPLDFSTCLNLGLFPLRDNPASLRTAATLKISQTKRQEYYVELPNGFDRLNNKNINHEY
jgi:hypothetical protein